MNLYTRVNELCNQPSPEKVPAIDRLSFNLPTDEIAQAAEETVKFMRNGGRKTTNASRSDAHKALKALVIAALA